MKAVKSYRDEETSSRKGSTGRSSSRSSSAKKTPKKVRKQVVKKVVMREISVQTLETVNDVMQESKIYGNYE